MACLVQSISHTPLWCLLLTMLIISLSICRPSPSIIFPQIAVPLTREQFLKSLQILFSFSQQLPSFWSGADLALSPGWLTLPCCLPSAKVPLLWNLSHPICSSVRLMVLPKASAWQHGELCGPTACCLQGARTHPVPRVCTLCNTVQATRRRSQDFCLVPDSSACAIKHQPKPVLQTQLPTTSMHKVLSSEHSHSEEKEPLCIRTQMPYPVFIWLMWQSRTNYSRPGWTQHQTLPEWTFWATARLMAKNLTGDPSMLPGGTARTGSRCIPLPSGDRALEPGWGPTELSEAPQRVPLVSKLLHDCAVRERCLQKARTGWCKLALLLEGRGSERLANSQRFNMTGDIQALISGISGSFPPNRQEKSKEHRGNHQMTS